ncbi:MAG: SdiA-regulated domain-containing protein [Synechococcus sp.]
MATHFPYDFKQPIKSYALPDQYKEISGVSPLASDDCLAFVQDEAVQIHCINLNSGTITDYAKHDDGDSEDIAVAGTTAYLLKAGKQPALYEVSNFNSTTPCYKRYDLALHHDQDPEGLCHDAQRHRLYIACKRSTKKNDTTRSIYVFDLQSMEMNPAPLFNIDNRDCFDNTDGTLNPSGLALHPQTDDLYIIGSKGEKMIVCYGLNGEFKQAQRLNEDQFIQPEGIAFLQSGELVISSEGKKGKNAEILIFSSSSSNGRQNYRDFI